MSTKQNGKNIKLTKVELLHLADRMVLRICQDGHLCGFSDEQIIAVIQKAQQIMEPEKATLKLRPPIMVFGDVHGQLSDLLKFFQVLGPPPDNKFLFLGDYVDRCKKSFEVIMLLLCYKVQFPNKVYLLRGNHECMKMNRLYGFYEEMRRKRSVAMWKIFNDLFNEFPLCAAISNAILCMHGGISPHIKSWNCLNNLQKPRTPRSCDEGIAVDLMWSDPSSDGCCPNFQFNNNRATSVIFGEESVNNICKVLNISLIARAHEMVKGGHAWSFDNKLVTLFSAPNYCGTDGNCGSVMKVSKHLDISFFTLKPILERTNLVSSQQQLLERQTQLLAAKSPDPSAKKEMFSDDKDVPKMPEVDLLSGEKTESEKKNAVQPTDSRLNVLVPNFPSEITKSDESMKSASQTDANKKVENRNSENVQEKQEKEQTESKIESSEIRDSTKLRVLECFSTKSEDKPAENKDGMKKEESKEKKKNFEDDSEKKRMIEVMNEETSGSRESEIEGKSVEGGREKEKEKKENSGKDDTVKKKAVKKEADSQNGKSA